MAQTRRSKTMAKRKSKAWRRANQRATHERIRRQRGSESLPTYKNGGPKPSKQPAKPVATAPKPKAVAAPLKKTPVVTVVVPPRGAKAQAGDPDVPKGEDPGLKASLALPIEELDLRIRNYNSLKRERINTVGDLTQRTEADLLDIRNYGQKSVDEVKAKLAAMGLALKGKAATGK